MVVLYCYLERGNDEVLKLHANSSSFFVISDSLFYVLHLKALKLNKCRKRLLEEIR